MPPKKRGLEEGGGEGAGDGGGGPPSPVLKKRCRSFDLEIRGCRHLQELAATCLQSVQTKLEATLESAVTRVDQNGPTRCKLCFMNGLDSEVFTKKTICATNGEPLKICMVVNDQQTNEGVDPHRLLSAKIKVVVLDGDFNRHNQEYWTSDEFNNHIVLPRDNVGAVLTGVSELSLKNGEAFLHKATFADNSKFMRSGKFRLGVMVDDNIGERVLEGITEPFIVKDRRGEGNKKHDIPLLSDDAWRLRKISRDGVFDKALRGGGIFSVQDFLRLYYKDEQALRKILFKATELVWTTIVEHAKKCDPGRKLYSFVMEGNDVTLFFNSVYQIVGAAFGDDYTPFSDLDRPRKDLVGQWSKDAYKNMTCDQPDYEMYNGKPRPINQAGNVCQRDGQQGTSGSNSNQCTLKRLGSVRITQSDEDSSFDFDVFLDSSSEQYCASTTANDITGLVTVHCATTAANETTGSVVLTQASLTMDNEVYDLPFTNNDVSISQLCEEQQPVQAHVGASLCAIRALADCPLYSRHSSFKEAGCGERAALGAEPAV